MRISDWSSDVCSSDLNKVQTLATRVMHHFSAYRDAQIIAVAPPAVTKLGNATGFDFELQDRGGLGHAKLIEARNQFLGLASKSKKLVGVRPNGLSDEPQYKIAIDWEKARALGLATSDINEKLSAAWGSAYVNQFIDRGRSEEPTSELQSL